MCVSDNYELNKNSCAQRSMDQVLRNSEIKPQVFFALEMQTFCIW